ncbi:uncharacterized protein LAESUDRAFT_695395 [Laetiporus sulphureus 93-53]|uniref:RNA polymerase I-specific transcription initiation factor RRN6-like protein n=1 Tax=Laetiporus sulphureus 93-53 TaxID=1314785 RepID=A0A165G0H3_9APHY|nr:uncharacterized protein LAESUDRAFT_695395 [Laetiporus sulphureus 93-53]KZT09664.1 hypothetical protein LAESUDRAFT_695395 [Laetiporus sulphureus 93-53]
MDQWPADLRATRSNTAGRGKDEGEDNSEVATWTYPQLEHGALAAATLHQQGHRLEWTFLSGRDIGRRLLSRCDSVEVFPQTRRADAYTSHAVLRQQGAKFIHTHYLDVGNSSKMIREQIAENASTLRDLEQFYPYEGSIIEAFSSACGNDDDRMFLTFPMGESFRELNISPVEFSNSEGIKLIGTPEPAWTFHAPIYQIAAPSIVAGGRTVSTILAVRTWDSANLLIIEPPSTRRPFELRQLVSYSRSDVEDRCIVDMMPIPGSLAMLVNDKGTVFKCVLRDDAEALLLPQPRILPSDSLDDNMWRLAPWNNEESCVLMSGRAIHHLDLRTQGTHLELYHTRRPSELLTAIEHFQEDRMIRLVSTNEIMWIDQRNTKRPVLGIKHGRESERTLRPQTQNVGGVPITFLTSRQNGLVTVYDVSRSTDNLVHLHAPAYPLPSMHTLGRRNLGHSFLHHPSDDNEENVSILRLTDVGSIQLLELNMAKGGVSRDAARLPRQSPERSADFNALRARMRDSLPKLGPLDWRMFIQKDLQIVYNRLLCARDDASSSRNADAVFELLKKMSSFWQDEDIPIEYTLTTHDIAFRSGARPIDASRDDIFAGNSLNSKSGFRALVEDHIPVNILASRVSWHLNIVEFLRSFIPDLLDNHDATLESLGRYDLLSEGDRPAEPLYRELEAREQLLVDLSLSSDVFAPWSFGRPVKTNTNSSPKTMPRAAEAMAVVGSEPPPVHFGFLHPVPQGSVDSRKTERKPSQQVSESFTPLGVRLLLQEWEVGTDPQAYHYEDPYGVVLPKAPSDSEPSRVRRADTPALETAAISQRPPTIVSAAAPAPPPIATTCPAARRGIVATIPAVEVEGRSIVDSRSQPTESARLAGASSRIPMASTQVLPGRHGGRPAPAKKPAKRVSGF